MCALQNRAQRIGREPARGVNDGENCHDIGPDSIDDAVGLADDLTKARPIQLGHDSTGQRELN